MRIVSEIKIAESNNITVHVPDDMINKEIEIIVKETKKNHTFNAFRINTRQNKFNREEANER